MSRTYHHGERRIRVRGVKRDPTDLRRLARALIELSEAEAEAQAEVEHQAHTPRPKGKGKASKKKKSSNTKREGSA